MASQNGKDFTGELQNRFGNFSHWLLRLNEKQGSGFGVIINERSSVILNQKNDLDAGGPFLEAASPDSEIVVFDYGTGPGPRGLEMRDSEGKLLLKDTYLGKIEWTGNSFEYGIPKSLPINLNERTKACADVGAAWEVEQYSFDGKEKIKLHKPPTIKCSN